MNTFLAVIFLAVVAPNMQKADSTSQIASEAAVRQANEAWATAIAGKAIEQTIALYDPEAVTAGSAMFPASGVAAFRENWTKLFAQPDFFLAWTVDKVMVTESGMIAYSTGSWRMAGPNTNGPYIAVWRKQPDGQWKVLIDAAWYGHPTD